MRLSLNRPLTAPPMRVRRVRPPRTERGERFYYVDVSIGGKRTSLSTRCTDPHHAARVRDAWIEEEELRLREGREWTLEEAAHEVDRRREAAGSRSRPFADRVLATCDREWHARGLSEISEEEWLAWRDTVEERSSKATARRYMSYLKGVYRDAVEARRCKGNTVERITLGGVSRSRQRTMPYSELERVQSWLAENAPHDYLRFIFAWQALTGLRIRTTLQSTWSMFELDAEQGELHIPGELTKTGEPIDSYLSPQARRVLRLWRYTVEAEKGRPVDPHGSVWPRDYDTVRTRWTSALRRANVKPYSIHDLKRTFFEICVRTNVSWQMASQMSGNRNAQVVLDHYTSITPETARAVFEGRAPTEVVQAPLAPLRTGGVWIPGARGESGHWTEEI